MGDMNLTRFAAVTFAVAALFTTLPAHASEIAPQAAQLIARSGRALGIESIRSVRTIRFDGTVSAIGLNGTATQYVDLRNGNFAETANLAPLVQSDGYDGRVTWNADGTNLVWNDGSDSGLSSEINQAYLSSYGLWRPNAGDAKVEWLGPKNAAGRSYIALSITPVGSKLPFELWFDATTNLPVQVHSANSFTTFAQTMSDYRRVSGLNVPHKLHTESSDGNNSDATVTSVSFDPPGAEAALARPQTQPTDFSIAGGKTSTTIPMMLGENHVYLDVMLNGKGPYHFIFDTGGSNVVDPAVAKEIGAVGEGALHGSGVGTATEGFSFGKVATLQAGDAVLKDQLFAIAPTRMGFGVSAGREVDGLIGWEVLARFVTTFDYANNTVTLTLPSAAQPVAGGHVVPFVFYGTQPQIACTIDGIPSECTIDTGARDTLSFMTPFVAAHPQIVPANATAVGVTGFGIGGPSMGKLGRISSVGIDDLQLTNLVADYSTQSAGALTARFIAANLGGNLLRRFNVTFDYGNGTMTFVPNASYAQAETYERSGLFLIKRGDSIMVLNARPGTPAGNAGIARGDTLVSIDGKPASALPLYEIRGMLAQPAGTVVTLLLADKAGTQRTVKLTLTDYV